MHEFLTLKMIFFCAQTKMLYLQLFNCSEITQWQCNDILDIL